MGNFEGVKVILSGGRYLAKDSGLTLNVSRTFKSGFVLGFFATQTDISREEFGEEVLTSIFIFQYLWILFQVDIGKIMQDSYGKI